MSVVRSRARAPSSPALLPRKARGEGSQSFGFLWLHKSLPNLHALQILINPPYPSPQNIDGQRNSHAIVFDVNVLRERGQETSTQDLIDHSWWMDAGKTFFETTPGVKQILMMQP
jgi:hypothetical protein